MPLNSIRKTAKKKNSVNFTATKPEFYKLSCKYHNTNLKTGKLWLNKLEAKEEFTLVTCSSPQLLTTMSQTQTQMEKFKHGKTISIGLY